MNQTRLERLRNRRLDPAIKVAGLNEAYARLPKEDTAVQYAIGAMQPIDPDYTRITIEERTRVEDQLSKGFLRTGLSVEFDYQGSVTNDTHIRAHSDVDLLTLQKNWHSVQPPNRPTILYTGDTIADLRSIRIAAICTLRSAYPAAKVDSSGAKAVNISGGSLRRKIDVISSAWWHTVEYVSYGQKYLIGIEILDNDRGERIANKPFFHNKRIEDQDTAMNGGLRKLIRLLKSLKYDSDTLIDLSSYDIAGIAFNMPDDRLRSLPGMDLALVGNCNTYLASLVANRALRESMLVPNGMRKVFCADGASLTGLTQLAAALNLLVLDISAGMTRSFRKLAEARIPY